MNYQEIRQKFRDVPAFRLDDIEPARLRRPHELIQLHYWIKNGKLLRLKKGVYTLNKDERRAPLSPLWLANYLYWPSYISLEYALSLYGLIPEAVGAITSVTTKKTANFNNSLGRFTYRNISETFFFGFKRHKTSEGQSYWMAEPEKALLDFIHLAGLKMKNLKPKFLMAQYRFQNLKSLKAGILRNYLTRMKSRPMQQAGRVTLELLKEST